MCFSLKRLEVRPSLRAFSGPQNELVSFSFILLLLLMQRELFELEKADLEGLKANDCMNINVGVLGHVDSGKTSICRVLTQVASTASLDKSPQSKERGITLDLGFSSFMTRVPEELETKVQEKFLQFTLVDCPGHASLIRAIIGGAQIIDLMFLVIDINKGIQAQTAECIIIAEMFIPKLIVVLNKVDCLEPQMLAPKITALRKVFSKTKFGAQVTMVPYSTKEDPDKYCLELKKTLLHSLVLPERQFDGKFMMLIDHCFKIKGKGTILTGTVTSGRAKPGDELQICEIQERSKIKTIEMFRKPLQVARQGDRVAMLMTHLESENIERGIACTPNWMKKIKVFVVDINKVRLYKRPIKNKTKFHIITGHQTMMGDLRLFYSETKQLRMDQVYESISDFEQKKEEMGPNAQVFAVVTLQKEMYGLEKTKVIGYKYDIENDQKQCRIAFHGQIQTIITPENNVRLFRDKHKKGTVDRVADNYTLIIKDLFSKEVDIQKFVGKEVKLSNGQVGKIDGAFGKSGKVRAVFKESIEGIGVEGSEVQFAFRKWYD